MDWIGDRCLLVGCSGGCPETLRRRSSTGFVAFVAPIARGPAKRSRRQTDRCPPVRLPCKLLGNRAAYLWRHTDKRTVTGAWFRKRNDENSKRPRLQRPSRPETKTKTKTTTTTMAEIRAAHLLIKHTGSRNPISRRTGEQITLKPADALIELEKYEEKIIKEGIHKAFPVYAQQRSDCSSYSRNGDLGYFGPGVMQKSFEDAAFELLAGEMSGPVSSDSGYHLIYRIA